MNTKRYKYGRTPHLPWSLGRTDDDKVLKDTNHFQGKEIVITEKMDGENTSLYFDGYTHARSIDSGNHESRNWLKQWWSERYWKLQDNTFRICGENLYAQHSIRYENLPSYFLGFSMWQNDICLSWEETITYFQLLDIEPVNVIYKGEYDENLIKQIILDSDLTEGYVIRLTEEFSYKDFSKSIAKYVRKNHVQSDKHWMHKTVIPNKLL